MSGKLRPAVVSYGLAAWIITYQIEHGGNTPSIAEMGDHFHKSKSGIHKLVSTLYGQGVVERLDGKLCVVGSSYIPPDWYIENINPPLPASSRAEYSRRNTLPILLKH